MRGLTLAVILSLSVSPSQAGEETKGGKAPSSEQAPKTPAKKPLYERLGGLKPITLVVDDFIDRLVSNDTLNANPAIKAGRDSSPPPYLKVQVSILVCKVTGGPCVYTGRDMKSAHAHLHITEAEWDVMAADFKASLDKFKVPQAEQDELFAIVGGTKKDIVVSSGPK